MAANILDNLANWSTTDASNQPDAADTTDLPGEFRRIQAVVRKYLATSTTLAAGATTDLSTATGNVVTLTGAIVTITSLGTVAAGLQYSIIANAAHVLTHNATSLILPTGANITMAAGDVAKFVSEGSGNWRCVKYHRANGQALAYSSNLTTLNNIVDLTTLTTLAAIASPAILEDIADGSFGPFSHRNRIINGAMSIDKRNSGAAQTITAAAALAYTVDRWYAYCTGANVTGQRVAGTAPNQYNYQFTGAASVTKIGFAQRIEAANSQDLAGKTATLAVDLANSLLTTVTWTAWYANTEDTFGSLASPTRTQIATGTFTVNGTLTRYSTNISIPSAATTGIEIELSVAAQTSGTWTIGRFQLEQGSVSTPFEHRPRGIELGMCQRYYQRLGGDALHDILWQDYNSLAGATHAKTLTLPVEMRVAPTATKMGTWGVTNCGQPGVVVATKQLVSTNVAGSAAGLFQCNTVDATTYINLEAEL